MRDQQSVVSVFKAVKVSCSSIDNICHTYPSNWLTLWSNQWTSMLNSTISYSSYIHFPMVRASTFKKERSSGSFKIFHGGSWCQSIPTRQKPDINYNWRWYATICWWNVLVFLGKCATFLELHWLSSIDRLLDSPPKRPWTHRPTPAHHHSAEMLSHAQLSVQWYKTKHDEQVRNVWTFNDFQLHFVDRFPRNMT